MRALAAWLFVALIMAVFIELGVRAFDHEWNMQMQRNQQWRALVGGQR